MNSFYVAFVKSSVSSTGLHYPSNTSTPPSSILLFSLWIFTSASFLSPPLCLPSSLYTFIVLCFAASLSATSNSLLINKEGRGGKNSRWIGGKVQLNCGPLGFSFRVYVRACLCGTRCVCVCVCMRIVMHVGVCASCLASRLVCVSVSALRD